VIIPVWTGFLAPCIEVGLLRAEEEPLGTANVIMDHRIETSGVRAIFTDLGSYARYAGRLGWRRAG
jgi:hypothetical protein